MNLTLLIASFVLVTIAELGDKTQFAVIALSAEYEFPLLVFSGVIIAFFLVTGLGAIVGTALTRVVPLKYGQLGSGFVFIIFGIAFLISAISGYTIFG